MTRIVTTASAIVGAVSRSHIAGLDLITDIGDTEHDVNCAAGEARDVLNAVTMALATETTKQIDDAWAVGDDAGGLDTGSVAADTLYAIWLIHRSDTGVVDILISASFADPTMPTDYDAKRLIGAVCTDSSANLIDFNQSGDYFRYTSEVIQDINDASITSNTFEVAALSVPPSAIAHFYVLATNATSTDDTSTIRIRTAGSSDVASGRLGVASLWEGDASTTEDLLHVGFIMECLVNTASQIAYNAQETSGTLRVRVFVLGFTMLTRRDP
ncbi:MAG: hypothetical protein V3V96_15385 [Acidiferrobacterales bacterium]